LTSTDHLFGFQIIVEREAPEPLVEFAVELGSDATSVVLPDAFIEPNAMYKFEVIAIGAGADPELPPPADPGDLDDQLKGNQTIAEAVFCTDAVKNVIACPAT
jgi:hypothetical protein